MFFTTTEKEREFKEELESKDAVENAEIKIKTSTEEVYIAADVEKHGLNLWELHDNYDFDIVSAWENPANDMLDICFKVE